MHGDVIGIMKDHPASLNRYVYYPDRLTRMPGPYPGATIFGNLIRNTYNFFTQPIFKGAFSAILSESTVAVRPSNVDDESVGDFLRRRFGATIADNMASALFHGIYAGDLYNLSARTLLPKIWYLETRDPDGSGINTEMAELLFRGQSLLPYHNIRFHNMTVKVQDTGGKQDEAALGHLIDGLKRCSVYTFGRGLASLTRRLEDSLRANGNITIKTEANVNSVVWNEESKRLAVSAELDESPTDYDYAVSSLSPAQTKKFFEKSTEARQQSAPVTVAQACDKASKSVNVMVVNLYYSNPELIPPSIAGFGYLIPRSISVEQNPERALGVIFGSESSGLRGEQAFTTLPKPSAVKLEQLKKYQQTLRQMPLPNDMTGPAFKRFGAERDPKMQELVRQMELTRERLERAQKDTEQAIEDYGQVSEETGQKELRIRMGQDTAPGTKLTIMMGGHWWDGWAEDDFPDEELAIAMAKNVLARHLGITEQPTVAKARLNRDAIPQYHVGYRGTMAKIHEGLKTEFRGRLKVAGPWWQGGVGVNDCVRKARETAFAIREGWDEKTGLEDYAEEEKWCLMDKRTGKVMIDPMSE